MPKPSDLQKFLPDSRRFKKYSRDKSERGQSLALSAILTELKKSPDFAIFEPILRETITQIRGFGSETEKKRDRVIQSLKSYASEISEIADETRIDKKEVEKICLELTREGLVRQDYRTHANELGLHKIDLFFWRANDEKYN